MTTIRDRTATALLIIDVQVGVVGAAHQRAAAEATVHELPFAPLWSLDLYPVTAPPAPAA